MYNAQKPDPSDLPSAMRLLKSTGIAAAAALVILVTVVLPAEYGVDPTRVGSVLGLTEMGRIKVQLAEEAAAEDATPEAETIVSETPAEVSPVAAVAAEEMAPVEPAAPIWRDEVTFTLAADAAAEYKLVMKEGETAEFVWFTDGAKANYDTHGDRPGLNYHNYEKDRSRVRKER